MVQTPEGRVKDKVKKVLKKHEAYWFCPVQNGMGSPSLDFLVCYKGLMIGIETKAPGKKPTTRQELTMKAMRKAGAICFVIDGDEMLVELELWLMANG